jgi:hypothetical protein
MHTCLICGIDHKEGIKYDGKWFCSEECAKIYCVFMGIEYRPQLLEEAA